MKAKLFPILLSALLLSLTSCSALTVVDGSDFRTFPNAYKGDTNTTPNPFGTSEVDIPEELYSEDAPEVLSFELEKPYGDPEYAFRGLLTLNVKITLDDETKTFYNPKTGENESYSKYYSYCYWETSDNSVIDFDVNEQSNGSISSIKLFARNMGEATIKATSKAKPELSASLTIDIYGDI